MTDARPVAWTALEALSRRAATSDRLRVNHNLHAPTDAVHRLFNATEPGTYVQPHRHLDPPRTETLTVVRGRGAVVTFDAAGRVTGVSRLGPGADVAALTLPPGCWHTLLALEPGTVWFEAKEGPYVPPCPADRAAWAPAEGDPDAARWLAALRASLDDQPAD